LLNAQDSFPPEDHDAENWLSPICPLEARLDDELKLVCWPVREQALAANRARGAAFTAE